MRERTLRALAVAAWLNFVVFGVVDVYLGGDALNGKVENGRYFLNNHGPYAEVSHATFLYSAVHATTAILGMCFFVFAARQLRRNSG